MEEKKNIQPEEQLDALLAQFLAEPAEEPTAAPVIEELPEDKDGADAILDGIFADLGIDEMLQGIPDAPAVEDANNNDAAPSAEEIPAAEETPAGDAELEELFAELGMEDMLKDTPMEPAPAEIPEEVFEELGMEDMLADLPEPDAEKPAAEAAEIPPTPVEPTPDIQEETPAAEAPADPFAEFDLAALLADIPDLPEPEAEVPAPEQPEQSPAADGWLDTILNEPIDAAPISADEEAVAAAGLTHPEDLEYEQILHDTMREEWSDAEAEAEHTVREPVPSAPLIFPDAAPEDPGSGTPPAEGPKETEEMEEFTEEADDESLPPRKVRPKKKGGYGLFGIPHMLATLIWLAIVVFIGVGLGNILWNYAADMLAFGREDTTVTITISANDTLDTVAEKLQTTGLIKYSGLFKLYGQLSNAMDDINPGTYKLNTLYDYNALVDAMSGYGSRVTTKVTIPEGYTCSQIFRLLESKGVCTAAELEEAAANAELGDYWFLEGVERGTATCLEGYLFPDTYTFYLDHSPEGVLKKFLDNFDNRFTDIMKDKLVTLNETLAEMMRKQGLSEDYIAEHQITIREVVIIASMIEKETSGTSESYTISSVIYNRLTDPADYPYLNIDAALVYYVGHSPLTEEDLALDTPYNTYKSAGLIPGPISNPGRSSLDAALDPDSTNYHYYALDPSTGSHHFSKTYAEHQNFLNSLKKDD